MWPFTWLPFNDLHWRSNYSECPNSSDYICLVVAERHRESVYMPSLYAHEKSFTKSAGCGIQELYGSHVPESPVSSARRQLGGIGTTSIYTQYRKTTLLSFMPLGGISWPLWNNASQACFMPLLWESYHKNDMSHSILCCKFVSCPHFWSHITKVICFTPYFIAIQVVSLR